MELTFEALAALTGRDCTFVTTGGPVPLTLTDATPHPHDHPGGELIFTGSSEQPLDQGTFDVRCDDVSGALFVVPISDDGQVRTYQAIFS